MKAFVEFNANGVRRQIEVVSIDEIVRISREVLDCYPSLVFFEDEITGTEYTLRKKKRRPGK